MRSAGPLTRLTDGKEVFTDTTVDVFTASGVWTKRPGVKAVTVTLVGGGGAGGGGRRGAAGTVVSGGGGGAAAGWTEVTIPATLLDDEETVIVGAGGLPADPVLTDSTAGSGGAAGGTSVFAGMVQATGGSGGIAGNTAATGSVVGGRGEYSGATGSGSSVSGTPATSVSQGGVSPGGGGAGASMAVASTILRPGFAGDAGTADAGIPHPAGAIDLRGPGSSGISRAPYDRRGSGGGAGGSYGSYTYGPDFAYASFTVPSNTTVEAYTPELGSVFAKHSSSPANTGMVYSATGDATSASTGGEVVYQNPTPTPDGTADYAVECVISHTNTTANTNLPKIFLRMVTGAVTYYYLYVNESGSMNIYRVVTGTTQNLGSFVYTFALGVNYKVKFMVVGSELSAWIDDVCQLIVTDANITAAGTGGWAARNGGRFSSYRQFAVTAQNLNSYSGGDGGFPGGGGGGSGASRNQITTYPVGGSIASSSFTTGTDIVLSSYTPEVGAGFVRHPSYATNATVSSSDGKVRGTSDTVTSLYFSNEVVPADYAVRAVIRWTGTAGNALAGVTARTSKTANTFYGAYFDDAANTVILHKVTAGTNSNLATAAYTLPADTDFDLVIQCVGSSIQVIVNDSLLLSVRDGSIATGQPGIRTRGSGRVDDFRVFPAVTGTPAGGAGKGGDGLVLVKSHF